jgi:crotonobetainyl-CoA:carnitine CoA-transferase CaiB-like acyl-CoA transferase
MPRVWGGAVTRVLELSEREESAAYCGKLLRRWGAEVIRAEPPARPAPGEAVDRYLNGGKRRVALDYRAPADLERLRALAASCDLVVTDAPARDVEQYGLLELGGGAPAATVSITGFGLSGPYRDFEAVPATLLALGGHSWLMGDPGRAPLTMPGRYAYYQAGTFAYVAAIAALLSSERARQIEVNVFEALVSLHQFTDTMLYSGGVQRSRHGNRWQNLCPTSLLPCADGWYGVNILERFWPSFALMIGHPEFTDDHPFATNGGRMEHEDEVEAVIEAALGDRPKAELFREGQETWRVPIGAALSTQDLLEDRHLLERDFWQPLGDSGLRTAGSPFRFVGEPPPLEAEVEAPGATAVDAIAESASESSRSARVEGGAARPLAGTRVLDLTRIWSGPLAARILGDLGAEVIKIEAPLGRGPATATEQARMTNPEAGAERHWNKQALFNKLQRNREGLAIDLKTERGHEIFLRLVAQSDVMIENFSARAMPGLGLGYQALREANPRIVYLTMPAFGRDGPYRDYVGLGPSIEPSTGLTAVMGYSNDEPRVTAKAITDAMAGTAAAAAVLTALERRRRTGEGAFLDLSQHEVGVAILGEYMLARQLDGAEPERVGNSHPQYAPHGVYRCAGEDEWIALAARDGAEWAALCAEAGAGWETDLRFASMEGRRDHRAELDAAIEGWTAGLEKRALMTALQARGVPAGAVLKPEEWTVDPHLEARGYFTQLVHAEMGQTKSDGSPLVFEGDRGYEQWRAAPTLGGDNAAVLSRVLGMSSSEIAELEAQGVIMDHPPE